MVIIPNPEIELGLVDENLLKKMEMTPEDFLKFNSGIFKQHSFRMKISENAGQITQPGINQDVDVYFEHVLVNDGLETDPKILMGYTEYSSKTETEEFWFIRDLVFMPTWDDTLKNTQKIGTLDEVEKRKVLHSLVRNMLKNLATSGSWIEISPSDTSGTLNFSIDNAGDLLNYNVRETDKFRAVCKKI